jgi:DUF1680 family protein
MATGAAPAAAGEFQTEASLSRENPPMKRSTVVVWAFALLAGAVAATRGSAADAVAPKAALKAAPVVEPFAMTDVRLLPGPFRHAMELDKKYLLSLDPDRLLHAFRVNAGLPSKAAPLGGWEEPKSEVRGHFPGHYLSACALMYAGTGDARLKDRANYMVAELAKCQAALRSGYLSAYPETFMDRVEAGKPVWAPWYTLHKIHAGLLDVYVHCGNPQALEAAKKFGDWVVARHSRLSDDQMQNMLGNEHGGINESMANLYALTGDEKYLGASLRLNHMAVLGPASKRQDRLTGLHANTQIPKFIGAARQYELTASDWLKTASDFFWNTVVYERSYVIGGHSDGEAFTPKEKFSEAFGPSTTETCNTYNMLKLTRHQFTRDPKAEYADYYERALYNHILCSQNPESGMMCYYVPLRAGSQKVYSTPLDSFWCCVGTGVENHAKYGDSIYFHKDHQTLYVNLFIASELDWKAKGVKLRQETKYPDEPSTRLAFTCDKPVEMDLCVRHPYWAVRGIAVAINGEKQPVDSKPGSYATISRTWRTGDVVEVNMPFTLRTEGFRDNPNRLACLYGPIVLAAQIDGKKPAPAIVADKARAIGSLAAVAGKSMTFVAPASVFRIPGERSCDVTFEPFFRLHGNRSYAVYWDLFTPEQWKGKELAYQAELARQRELELRTIDCVAPGGEQNERDHKLAGEKTQAGDFGDRKWRHAIDGGWFSYEVKIMPGKPQELSVTYWGSDAGNRVFDILVDGRKLATQKLQHNRPERFFDQVYTIPAGWTEGKEKATVRFQGTPGNFAGGIFGLRTMRPADAPR